MASLRPGQTLQIQEEAVAAGTGEQQGSRLVVRDDDRGRVRGHELELDGQEFRLQRTGERSELVTGTGTPVLRFDPAGRKATTLTTSTARYRLARQRNRPLLHSWRLTRDVHGDEVLEVRRTPLGTKVVTVEGSGVAESELAVLALAALVEVMDIEPAAVTA